MIPIIALALKIIIIAAIVIYCLDWAGFRPFRRRSRSSKSSQNVFSSIKSWQEDMQCGPLRHKLLKRVDRGTADRLINAAKYKTPGKSERWYLEKVIYDLERGR